MASKKPNYEAPAPAEDKKKALDTALHQIEKNFGKGSVMRLGDRPEMNVDAIPTGSLALDGGEDGLDFYRAIIQNFRPALNPGGWLCFEFGMGQESAVCSLLEQGGFTVTETRRDTADIIRAVLAQKREDS